MQALGPEMGVLSHGKKTQIRTSLTFFQILRREAQGKAQGKE